MLPAAAQRDLVQVRELRLDLWCASDTGPEEPRYTDEVARKDFNFRYVGDGADDCGRDRDGNRRLSRALEPRRAGGGRSLVLLLASSPRFVPAGGEVVAQHLKGRRLLILGCLFVLILRGMG
jgi:hypothetical protein